MNAWNTFAKKFEEIGNPEQPWKPGVSIDTIKEFEKNVGVTFPQELIEYFSVCDRPMIVLCAPWTLMQFSFVTSGWETQKELAKMYPHDTESYNLAWIPLLDSGGGDYHCVDLSGEGGAVGQIVSYFHDKDERHVLASSITDYFEKILNEIHAGNLVPANIEEDERGLVAKEGTEAARMFYW